MHWAYKIANELINRYPNKNTFVCASGISPSGSVHIGNFREIVTTHFVVKALQHLGKKTRFIFSWDDYDRFRKVPKNVDPSFEKYIGMPYANIPDPFGCHASYAEHFEQEFEKSLSVFGIEVEFLYQSKEYRTGRYNKHILHALKQRKEIYDIITDFKTSDSSEEEKNNFYPVALYCENCGKDHTEIKRFDEENETIEYVCSCGNHSVLSVMSTNNMKLNWKIDWPMRWMAEDVIFEPGGRDHSSETGSYNVSKEIASRIFNYKAPSYVAYDFIGIKGDHKKMSSSAGNIITPSELLNIYSPEIVLFMFSKYKPNATFNIGLDEDVIRNYSEYERFRDGYRNGVLQDEDICSSLELSKVSGENVALLKFNQVAGVLPLVNFQVQALQNVISKTGEEYRISDIKKISDRVEYWIKNWYPQKMICVNDKKDIEYYETLNEVQKKWLQELCDIIRDSSGINDEQFMEKIYAICHDDDKKNMRANQKLLFNMVYRLVLNSSSGPRLPILVEAVGAERMIALLAF